MNELDRRDRIRGSLLAGAVGDALGAPVEFWSWSEIERKLGPAGVVDYLPAYGLDRGAITDDTQMTLFTAEGLLATATADSAVDDSVWVAYRRWLHTQDDTVDVALDGWLVHQQVLRHQRAPGGTCLAALHGNRPGTPANPVNNSKGCGGVMRVAPVGLLETIEDPFAVAADAAALTHGHPSGYLSAGVLAHAIRQLLAGATMSAAIDDSIVRLCTEPGHHETLDALFAAKKIAEEVGGARITPAALESLGGGWTGEEALAIAVACALVARDLREALLLSVNHSGDTDSTGSICGNLVGALYGVEAIPAAWRHELEAADIVERIADELYAAKTS